MWPVPRTQAIYGPKLWLRPPVSIGRTALRECMAFHFPYQGDVVMQIYVADPGVQSIKMGILFYDFPLQMAWGYSCDDSVGPHRFGMC